MNRHAAAASLYLMGALFAAFLLFAAWSHADQLWILVALGVVQCVILFVLAYLVERKG